MKNGLNPAMYGEGQYKSYYSNKVQGDGTGYVRRFTYALSRGPLLDAAGAAPAAGAPPPKRPGREPVPDEAPPPRLLPHCPGRPVEPPRAGILPRPPRSPPRPGLPLRPDETLGFAMGCGRGMSPGVGVCMPCFEAKGLLPGRGPDP